MLTDSWFLPAKKAEDAAKGYYKLHGLEIVITHPADTVRSGTDKNGKEWSNKLKHHYGYIADSKKTKDGEKVDVIFDASRPSCELVHIVNQVNPVDRSPDERKVLLGFDSRESAADGYLSQYNPAWRGMGNIVQMTIKQFHKWLKDGDMLAEAVEPGVS